MSKIWPHFTKQNPCLACGGSDWCCRAGEKKFLCMRIQSDHPAKDGGFYHEYSGKKPVYIPPKRSAPKVGMDFDAMMKRYNFSSCEKLALTLGVNEKSLFDLNVFWLAEYDSWAIPMRDGDNKIIGIHLRCEDGSKKAVVSSRNGLFIPQINPQKVAFICEGASNTTALLTMGFYAIGRPSCNSGGELLKVALKRLGVSRIVIVADNDTIKSSPDGRTFRPGQDGSKKLKKELGLMSVIFTTPNPVKDVRQLLQKLGVESARNYIQNSVNQKIWTKI
jgi:hypothetical protein